MSLWAVPACGFELFARAPSLSWRLVAETPHDPAAFTQGLLFADGVFYESDGLYGRSRLARIDPADGRTLQHVALPPEYFGEGLVLRGETLYQLTWREGRVLLYDRRSLEKIGERPLTGEGWGICDDGQRFIVSDGTPTLRFFEPETFKEIGRLTVTDGGKPVERLNELEYVDGRIFANVWGSDFLAVISPETGKVLGWYDLSGLRSGLGLEKSEAALNGVAHDPATGRFFVTGKYWPKVFAIEPRLP